MTRLSRIEAIESEREAAELEDDGFFEIRFSWDIDRHHSIEIPALATAHEIASGLIELAYAIDFDAKLKR